ncbi:MAG: hypothetical protein FD163_1502 [Hyphomonadaceae bacterium]|nr:MAG: hypothetical protein FD128_274 [Hyphomonadaceae bacterium]KAF0184805.1 MAG: hypothetical protein FD163_1502 [Hyphomonadaceae bacterium]
MKKLFIATTALITGSAFVISANALPFSRRAEPPPASPHSITPEIQMPGQVAPAATPNATPAPKARSRHARPTPTAPAAVAAPTVPAPAPAATPEQRQAARTLPLVSQSTFWLNELEKNPADEEAAFEASQALRYIGSAERAVATAATGLQAHDSSGRLWACLGLGLLASNANEQAVQALSKAISLLPRDANVRNGLGIAYDKIGRSDLAITAYNEGLAIAPNDANLVSNLGFSMALNGDLAGGERMLRRAVALPNAPIQSRQNLALIVGLQGRLQESERLAAQDVPPDVAARNIAYIRAMLNGEENRWNTSPPSGTQSNSQAVAHASN